MIKKCILVCLTCCLALLFSYCNWFCQDEPEEKTENRYFVYTANPYSSSILSYSIDTKTGALKPLTTYPTTEFPDLVITDRAGKYLYMLPGGPVVCCYSITPDTGALNFVGRFVLGKGPDFDIMKIYQAQIDPSGKFLYISMRSGNGAKIIGETIDPATGGLSRIPGSPWPYLTRNRGIDPAGLTLSPNGKFLYIADWQEFTVSAKKMDAATGALGFSKGVFPIESRNWPASIAVDNSSNFLYIGYGGYIYEEEIQGYRIDQDTGILSKIDACPNVGVGPVAMSFYTPGNFLYVVNINTNNITGFAMNPANGKLTAIDSWAAGSCPVALAIETDNKYLYVINQYSDNISGYNINPVTGALNLIHGSPWASTSGPRSITIVKETIKIKPS